MTEKNEEELKDFLKEKKQNWKRKQEQTFLRNQAPKVYESRMDVGETISYIVYPKTSENRVI